MKATIKLSSLPKKNINSDFLKKDNDAEIAIYSTMGSLFIGSKEYTKIFILQTENKLPISALNISIVDEVKLSRESVAVYYKNLTVLKRNDKEMEHP